MAKNKIFSDTVGKGNKAKIKRKKENIKQNG